MSQIAVIAKIPCQPGKRDEVASSLQPMLDHVESEEGTLRYVLLKDSADENLLWMYELYADQAGLDAHLASGAMKELGHSLAGLLTGRPELNFTTPVGGKGL